MYQVAQHTEMCLIRVSIHKGLGSKHMILQESFQNQIIR